MIVCFGLTRATCDYCCATVCMFTVLIHLLEKCDHDAPLNQLHGFFSSVVKQPGTHILYHQFLVQSRCVECSHVFTWLGLWEVVSGRKKVGRRLVYNFMKL